MRRQGWGGGGGGGGGGGRFILIMMPKLGCFNGKKETNKWIHL